ncbi:Gfo/Idh/MocA family protein [Paenibacillus soyae]|uniref:Gfo/Idh/MocA family oxidoreductase n=1 Tax=Paenibacillus soyae TaxID=2969249 RepID=A0A9X2SBS4_9BACL|nr:Gfo/Idh/MocA family oxidoreductase [Paenibacillus soyae]MCR2807531.1 Gfo/Idh/MocA family oxidoreductase [Paenibacillus soyae]
MQRQIRFGLIGGGWRAAFYLRIAAMLPHQFRVSGILLRSPEKYSELLAKWNVPVYSSADALAKECDFLVLAVSKTAAASRIAELAEAGIPVLAETPPAVSLAEYERLTAIAASKPSIQVAEQYPLLPHHQARTAYAQAGKIGGVHHVQASAGHGYHGISLIRKWLSIDPAESCEIIGRKLTMPIADVPYRDQDVSDDREGIEQQEIAILQFGSGKSALLDFSRSQYFSPIRSNRILIRGTHGEIRDNDAVRKLGAGRFENVRFERVQSGQEGSLAPLSLLEIRAGAETLYRNPFTPHPLSDEELGIAEALLKMDRFIRDGVPFYSLVEALADVRLALAIEQSLTEAKAVTIP